MPAVASPAVASPAAQASPAVQASPAEASPAAQALPVQAVPVVAAQPSAAPPSGEQLSEAALLALGRPAAVGSAATAAKKEQGSPEQQTALPEASVGAQPVCVEAYHSSA
mmetsp:Transcript_50961/g.111530  ORF Transcript_50961/g.111530 Transcript_50961/m.111530 type:complete len:110 (-) Transcript_50961:2512-2841(-)